MVVIVWVIVQPCSFFLPREPTTYPCSVGVGRGFPTSPGQWTPSHNKTQGLKRTGPYGLVLNSSVLLREEHSPFPWAPE